MSEVIAQGDGYYEGHPTGMEAQVKKMHEERERQSLEMERLCYEVYITNADGARLLKMFHDRFVVPGLAAPQQENFKNAVVYFEGFKEAFRGMSNMATNHLLRLNAGNK